MTVTSTTAISGPYNGNGSTTQFDYTFYIADESELVVTLANSSGTETVQTLTTHYTVSIGGDGTGTFTMVTAPAEGETVAATLNVPLTQATDLLNYGTFSAETHEAAFDKLTRICQQQEESLSRCLRVGVTSGTDPDDVVTGTLVTTSVLDLRAMYLLDESSFSVPASSATLGGATEDWSDYDILLVEIVRAVPSVDGSYLRCQTYSSGSLQTSGYMGAGHGVGGNGTPDYPGWAYNTGTALTISDWTYTAGNSATEGVSGSFRWYQNMARCEGQSVWEYTNGELYGASFFGSIAGADKHGFKFFFDTGNIGYFHARVWGLPTGS